MMWATWRETKCPPYWSEIPQTDPGELMEYDGLRRREGSPGRWHEGGGGRQDRDWVFGRLDCAGGLPGFTFPLALPLASCQGFNTPDPCVFVFGE